MGEFKGTEIGEIAGDFETLVLYPSFHQDEIFRQVIYIAGSQDTVSMASLQYCKRNGNTETQFSHFWFTPEEIDILVKALLEAKEKVLKIELAEKEKRDVK